MSLFNKRKEPVFLKESSDAQRQLTVLKALEPRLTFEGQKKIRQDIKYLEYGILGENQIAFELKNSHMPMYILHDIYLETGDLSAQIDYIVVTAKICFLLECKNLFGDIEINSKGEFIRTLEIGGRKRKEGIYSPITQNERHLELLRLIKANSRGNVITRFMTEKYFSDFYKAIVVLANPRTVLNDRYAKREIRDKVVRADQLIAYIKRQCELSKELESSDEKMKEWAESFLKLHKEKGKDYTQKYLQYLPTESEEKADTNRTERVVEDGKAEEQEEGKQTGAGGSPESENRELFEKLKRYRLDKSREEQIKAYYIFNNNQLTDLISKMPVSKQELQAVSGFGPTKTEKYGDDILNIIAKYADRRPEISS